MSQSYLIETDAVEGSAPELHRWIDDAHSIISVIRKVPGQRDMDWAATTLRMMIERKRRDPNPQVRS